MSRIKAFVTGNVKQLATEDDIKRLFWGAVFLNVFTIAILHTLINGA